MTAGIRKPKRQLPKRRTTMRVAVVALVWCMLLVIAPAAASSAAAPVAAPAMPLTAPSPVLVTAPATAGGAHAQLSTPWLWDAMLGVEVVPNTWTPNIRFELDAGGSLVAYWSDSSAGAYVVKTRAPGKPWIERRSAALRSRPGTTIRGFVFDANTTIADEWLGTDGSACVSVTRVKAVESDPEEQVAYGCASANRAIIESQFKVPPMFVDRSMLSAGWVSHANQIYNYAPNCERLVGCITTYMHDQLIGASNLNTVLSRFFLTFDDKVQSWLSNWAISCLTKASSDLVETIESEVFIDATRTEKIQVFNARTASGEILSTLMVECFKQAITELLDDLGFVVEGSWGDVVIDCLASGAVEVASEMIFSGLNVATGRVKAVYLAVVGCLSGGFGSLSPGARVNEPRQLAVNVFVDTAIATATGALVGGSTLSLPGAFVGTATGLAGGFGAAVLTLPAPAKLPPRAKQWYDFTTPFLSGEGGGSFAALCPAEGCEESTRTLLNRLGVALADEQQCLVDRPDLRADPNSWECARQTAQLTADDVAQLARKMAETTSIWNANLVPRAWGLGFRSDLDAPRFVLIWPELREPFFHWLLGHYVSQPAVLRTPGRPAIGGALDSWLNVSALVGEEWKGRVVTVEVLRASLAPDRVTTTGSVAHTLARVDEVSGAVSVLAQGDPAWLQDHRTCFVVRLAEPGEDNWTGLSEPQCVRPQQFTAPQLDASPVIEVAPVALAPELISVVWSAAPTFGPPLEATTPIVPPSAPLAQPLVSPPPIVVVPPGTGAAVPTPVPTPPPAAPDVEWIAVYDLERQGECARHTDSPNEFTCQTLHSGAAGDTLNVQVVRSLTDPSLAVDWTLLRNGNEALDPDRFTIQSAGSGTGTATYQLVAEGRGGTGSQTLTINAKALPEKAKPQLNVHYAGRSWFATDNEDGIPEVRIYFREPETMGAHGSVGVTENVPGVHVNFDADGTRNTNCWKFNGQRYSAARQAQGWIDEVAQNGSGNAGSFTARHLVTDNDSGWHFQLDARTACGELPARANLHIIAEHDPAPVAVAQTNTPRVEVAVDADGKLAASVQLDGSQSNDPASRQLDENGVAVQDPHVGIQRYEWSNAATGSVVAAGGGSPQISHLAVNPGQHRFCLEVWDRIGPSGNPSCVDVAVDATLTAVITRDGVGAPAVINQPAGVAVTGVSGASSQGVITDYVWTWKHFGFDEAEPGTHRFEQSLDGYEVTLVVHGPWGQSAPTTTRINWPIEEAKSLVQNSSDASEATLTWTHPFRTLQELHVTFSDLTATGEYTAHAEREFVTDSSGKFDDLANQAGGALRCFRVKGDVSLGQCFQSSGPSSPVTYTKVGTPLAAGDAIAYTPAAPEGFTVQRANPEQVKFSWQSSSAGPMVIDQIDGDAVFGGTDLQGSYLASFSSPEETCWRVRAQSSASVSGFWSVTACLPPAESPTAVPTATPPPMGAGDFSVSWHQSASRADGTLQFRWNSGPIANATAVIFEATIDANGVPTLGRIVAQGTPESGRASPVAARPTTDDCFAIRFSGTGVTNGFTSTACVEEIVLLPTPTPQPQPTPIPTLIPTTAPTTAPLVDAPTGFTARYLHSLDSFGRGLLTFSWDEGQGLVDISRSGQVTPYQPVAGAFVYKVRLTREQAQKCWSITLREVDSEAARACTASVSPTATPTPRSTSTPVPPTATPTLIPTVRPTATPVPVAGVSEFSVAWRQDEAGSPAGRLSFEWDVVGEVLNASAIVFAATIDDNGEVDLGRILANKPSDARGASVHWVLDQSGDTCFAIRYSGTGMSGTTNPTRTACVEEVVFAPTATPLPPTPTPVPPTPTPVAAPTGFIARFVPATTTGTVHRLRFELDAGQSGVEIWKPGGESFSLAAGRDVFSVIIPDRLSWTEANGCWRIWFPVSGAEWDEHCVTVVQPTATPVPPTATPIPTPTATPVPLVPPGNPRVRWTPGDDGQGVLGFRWDPAPGWDRVVIRQVTGEPGVPLRPRYEDNDGEVDWTLGAAWARGCWTIASLDGNTPSAASEQMCVAPQNQAEHVEIPGMLFDFKESSATRNWRGTAGNHKQSVPGYRLNGQPGLAMQFSLSAGSGMGVLYASANNLPDADWTNAEALEFRFQGRESNRTYDVSVVAERVRYHATFVDDAEGWDRIMVPFAEFVASDGTTLADTERALVTHLQFQFDRERDQRFVLDEIRLYNLTDLERQQSNQRRENAERTAAMTEIMDALEAYGLQEASYRVYGGGWRSGGQGWFRAQTGRYWRSIANKLADEGFLDAADLPHDPDHVAPTTHSGRDFMVYRCADRVAVFAEAPGMHASYADRRWWSENGCTTAPATAYGKNYMMLSAPLTCGGKAITVNIAAGESPTTGDDVILGTDGNDVIKALTGNDVICGGQGNDVLAGNQQNDIIYGGRGNDKLYGGYNNDVVYGGAGDDLLSNNHGTDTMDGGEGTNTCGRGSNADVLINCA